ncbi:MAG TPA: radical SAM/SPASM domain-containing protein [bacterium]|nr:radical SAM/SPASM domain-containing protein [bacterium]
MTNLEDKILTVLEKGPSQKVMTGLLNAGLKTSVTRRKLLNAIDKATYKISLRGPERPVKVKEERYYMGRALLHSIGKALDNGLMSPGCTRSITDILLRKVILEGVYARREFNEKHGFRPPTFVTISPTNVCNLKCKGCYAGDIYEKSTLKYGVFDRVLTEINKEFGSYFFVISGGEPFAYRESGKTLFDILEKHSDSYFMAYTNSTMINKDAAKKLSELGNFTPAISVEGFEEETDERRGKGTYARIMDAMENLRMAGVPFGVSVTPTRHNADMLLSDRFIDFYFNRMGATYGWYFQYMPIGRNPSVELMVTPEQRLRMLKKIWEIVINQKIFIADFWNSGTASDGCMAAARGGGYFYIMWDGTITPCVFIPFKDRDCNNLYSLYENGQTITDAVKSRFFGKIREWQDNYWIKQPRHKCGNLLVPCAIRDNAKDFYALVKETGALPCDKGAKEYLSFIENGSMPAYNMKYREYTDPLWQGKYLENEQIQVN